MGVTDDKNKVFFLRGTAWFFSMLFHPLLMATWLFVILVFYAPIVLNPINEEGKKSLLIIIFISTFLLPLLILFTLFLFQRKNVNVKDFIMEKRGDRILPFFFTSFYYLSLSLTLFKEISQMLFVLMVGISALILGVSLISTIWKISAHAVGLGGILGFLLGISYLLPATDLLIPVILVLIAGGITLSSRLYLNSHTPAQTFVGYFFGLAGSLVTVFTGFIF